VSETITSSNSLHFAGRIDAVERAVGPVQRVVHGADPEATLRVATAIVQPVVALRRLHLRQQRLLARAQVEEIQPEVQSEQYTGGIVRQRERAGVARVEREYVMATAGRMEALELSRIDVQPQQRLRAIAPERRFTEQVLPRNGTAHVTHRAFLTRCSATLPQVPALADFRSGEASADMDSSPAARTRAGPAAACA
jgi:hypothetical protein